MTATPDSHEGTPSRSRGVSRRAFVSGAATVLGGALLAACGASGTSGGPHDLTFWTIDSFTTQGKGLAHGIERFEATHPGAHVTVQAFDPATYEDKLITAIVGGSGPDVAAIDSAWLAEFAAGRAIADLSDRYRPLRTAFFSGAARTGAYEGRQYAVPWYSNNVALYWNRSLFRRAGLDGPPRTWTQLREYGRELTGGGNHGLMLGANWLGPFLWWPFLWQNGGEIASPDGRRVTFASDEGIEAWQFYAELPLRHGIVPPSFIGVNESWDQYFSPFIQGRVAMMLTGDWGLYAVHQGAPHMDFGVAPLPRGRIGATVVGGYDLVIPAATRKRDAAWELIRWLTAEPQETILASYDRLPARVDTQHQRRFTTGPEAVFTRQASDARPRPVVPKWSQVEMSIMADAWDATINRVQSPAAALRAAAADASSTLVG